MIDTNIQALIWATTFDRSMFSLISTGFTGDKEEVAKENADIVLEATLNKFKD